MPSKRRKPEEPTSSSSGGRQYVSASHFSQTLLFDSEGKPRGRAIRAEIDQKGDLWLVLGDDSEFASHNYVIVEAHESVPSTNIPDLNALLERATEVIGDRGAAARWLGTPVKALGYKTPINVAATEGNERVLAILDRVEHGVW